MAPQESPFPSETLPVEALSGAERDARIEQLLLGGLDLYFAEQYEPAINLWTRVLFLDRHHGRARAYIERARSAQAERQRESEAVLHQGIAAFHAGDVTRARRLLADALDRGVSPDDAQGMLDRIERLGVGQTTPRFSDDGGSNPGEAVESAGSPTSGRGRGQGWTAALLLIAAAIGVLTVAAWGLALPDPASWSIFNTPTAATARVVAPIPPEPLPVVGASDMFLSRSRSLVARGQLRDALIELERIPLGDPVRRQAERLRADIQRHLLSLAAADGARTPPE